jgi:hypothetical protein
MVKIFFSLSICSMADRMVELLAQRKIENRIITDLKPQIK